MEKYNNIFEWVRPKGGCMGFPKIKLDIPVYKFAEDLLKKHGVLLLPSTLYTSYNPRDSNHFRIGFGRKDFPEALAEFQKYIDNLR